MTQDEHSVQIYHRRLPMRLRHYLNGRGIPDAIIDRFKLGWNGWRITIPVYDQKEHFASLRLAKDPADTSPQPKMLSTPGSRAELYGWEQVLSQPKAIVICEGEFDRLVLESLGFAAVTSTAGAGTFQEAWAKYFQEIPYVYVCFDLDEAGCSGARRVAQLIPHARIVHLPPQLGPGGDVTDFFTAFNRTTRDFRDLLDRAQPLNPNEFGTQPRVARPVQHQTPALADDVACVKARTSLEWLAGHYVAFRRSGRNLLGGGEGDRAPAVPGREVASACRPPT